MQTQLITIGVSLVAASDHAEPIVGRSGLLRSDALRSHIEAALSTYGTPLRWAITAVNAAEQTAQVEAVVTCPDA